MTLENMTEIELIIFIETCEKQLRRSNCLVPLSVQVDLKNALNELNNRRKAA